MMNLKLIKFNPMIFISKSPIHQFKYGFLGYNKRFSSSSGEKELIDILHQKFPNAKNISVEDISGGCGSMYQVFVESIDLKGLSIVKQHQTVTNALKEQIKTFHGIRIETKIPKN